MNYKSNEQVLEELDKTVFGHTYAKKVLINAVNRSKKRYIQKYRDLVPEDDLIPTLSCLLVGDSGTGKSFMVQELARIMKFPYITFDASQFNADSNHSGVSRKNIEDAILHHADRIYHTKTNHYQSIDGVLSQMVVFIDEFDKLGIDCYTGQYFRKVQSELLTLIENKEKFADVTFIYAGAFSNLELRTKPSKSIGFFNNSCKTVEFVDIDQQLITRGNILTEILGRIGIVAQLDHFTQAEYTEVFTKYILPQYNKHMKALGHQTVRLPAAEQDELIERAYKSGLGIRAIKRELITKSMDKEFGHDSFTEEDRGQLAYIGGL